MRPDSCKSGCTVDKLHKATYKAAQRTRGLSDYSHSSSLLVLASSPIKNSSRSTASFSFDFATSAVARTILNCRSASLQRVRKLVRTYDSPPSGLSSAGGSFGAEPGDCSRG